MSTTPSDVFDSTSSDAPQLIHVSFADDPTASLGVQLINCDTDNTSHMFLPGFAIVGRLLPGETVASKAGVQPGDCIVAVNGQGFRRFKPDADYSNATELVEATSGEALDHAVVPPGTAYTALLQKIKAVKAAAAGNDKGPPLTLALERYGWNARPLAWGRFLAARDDDVPAAMQMSQEHEAWRTLTFPIALKQKGLQRILQDKAVCEINIANMSSSDVALPPTVYVNYGKLQQLQSAGDITPEDVVQAFVMFEERLLLCNKNGKNKDPRHPRTCQFIDLSGVSLTSGFRVETLKQIYNTFEPNYPETLHKMVIYPVSSIMSMTATKLLSFVNEKTKKKFLITNDLEKVCTDLGWQKAEVEECGGVTEFMQKHETVGDSLLREL